MFQDFDILESKEGLRERRKGGSIAYEGGRDKDGGGGEDNDGKTAEEKERASWQMVERKPIIIPHTRAGSPGKHTHVV